MKTTHLFLFLLFCFGGVLCQDVRIYMAATGSTDANDGSLKSKPIRTLTRAIVLVKQKLSQSVKPKRIFIEVARGTYYNGPIRWPEDATDPNVEIIVSPSSPATGTRPIFDGCSSTSCNSASAFLTLTASGGKKTNLKFEWLHIRNYVTAFSFNGNRNSVNGHNSHNTVRGCRLENLGNSFNRNVSPGTAGIRFVNSDNNTIEYNDIINITGSKLLHAIYLAHLSDYNYIAYNTFQTCDGDPIRVRDFSNFNKIRNNWFKNCAAGGYYTTWFCDPANPACTKPTNECESYGNEFRNNVLAGGFNCGSASSFIYYVSEDISTCTPPPEARILRTSSNVRADCQTSSFKAPLPPTPKPTPAPTPSPTPSPTPAPTPRLTPSPTPKTPSPTPKTPTPTAKVTSLTTTSVAAVDTSSTASQADTTTSNNGDVSSTAPVDSGSTAFPVYQPVTTVSLPATPADSFSSPVVVSTASSLFHSLFFSSLITLICATKQMCF